MNTRICITHTQGNNAEIVAGVESRGLTVVGSPVRQIACGHDPNLRRGTDRYSEIYARITALEPGQDVYIDWEYPDHDAAHRLNTPLQLATKKELCDAIRARGCRAGIYAPFYIHSNARHATSEASIANMRAVAGFVDFAVQEVYVNNDFGPCEPARDRYLVNNLAGINAISRVAPGLEVMLAYQFRVRLGDNQTLPMQDHQAKDMGRVLSASGCTPLMWFEHRAGRGSAVDSRMAELDALAPSFVAGSEWHGVNANHDAGGPRGEA